MPCRPFCVSSRPPSAFILFLQMCEATYLAIFTFEMTVKIIAYGFAVGDDAYLKDAWCQLDFAVVTLAWLPILIPGFGNFSGAQLSRENARNLRARECAQPAPRTRRLHRECAACTENAQHREPTRTGETRRERWDHQPIFALTLPSSPCLPAVLALARVSLLQSSERFGRCGRCER